MIFNRTNTVSLQWLTNIENLVLVISLKELLSIQHPPDMTHKTLPFHTTDVTAETHGILDQVKE